MAIPRARSYKEGVEIAAASADGLAKTDDTSCGDGCLVVTGVTTLHLFWTRLEQMLQTYPFLLKIPLNRPGNRCRIGPVKPR